MCKEETLIPKDGDRLFCVKVGKVQRENLYEMSRKYWKAKLERAEKATHLLAISEGIVIAVYIPTAWRVVKERDNRIECDAVEDLHSEYIGKCVDSYYGFSANPVKYINC
jgi:hypothetical protein